MPQPVVPNEPADAAPVLPTGPAAEGVAPELDEPGLADVPAFADPDPGEGARLADGCAPAVVAGFCDAGAGLATAPPQASAGPMHTRKTRARAGHSRKGCMPYM
jgi:hypothetical protein